MRSLFMGYYGGESPVSVPLRPGFIRTFSLHFACAMLQSGKNPFQKKRVFPFSREKRRKQKHRKGKGILLLFSIPSPYPLQASCLRDASCLLTTAVSYFCCRSYIIGQIFKERMLLEWTAQDLSFPKVHSNPLGPCVRTPQGAYKWDEANQTAE